MHQAGFVTQPINDEVDAALCPRFRLPILLFLRSAFLQPSAVFHFLSAVGYKLRLTPPAAVKAHPARHVRSSMLIVHFDPILLKSAGGISNLTLFAQTMIGFVLFGSTSGFGVA